METCVVNSGSNAFEHPLQLHETDRCACACKTRDRVPSTRISILVLPENVKDDGDCTENDHGHGPHDDQGHRACGSKKQKG